MQRTMFLTGLFLLLAACGSEENQVETEDSRIRYFTNKAITGVSMGGGASAQIAFSQPDRWDFVGILGAPLVDLPSFARMLRRSWFSGFCSLEYLEARHESGESLDSEEAFCGLYTERALPELMPQQTVVPDNWLSDGAEPMWEFSSDYHNWWRGHAGGRGGDFPRHSLLGSLRDILKAYSSPLYDLNPDVPWAAPGVTQEWLSQSAEERCANPIVQENFYHAEYNPNGAYPVITFCEGNHNDNAATPEAYRARLLPDTPRTHSQAMFLAVDINRNGRRDYGEPMIHNSAERYDDFGPDGIPSDLEEGYDPVTNPDPAGDDYDPFYNVNGSENNYWHDEGEPYLDYGLDGVPETGDHGENSGVFERSPGWENAKKYDPHLLLETLSSEELARLNIYMDAGIRDFFNTAIHANRFFAHLQTMVDDDKTSTFQDLTGLTKDGESFKRFEPDYAKATQYTYVRYGDVNASATEIGEGDGNHLGTIEQAIDRVSTAFAIVQNAWPHADHTVETNPFGDNRYAGTDTYESETLGVTQEYTFILPPGYHEPENAERRYPVLFLLHGQGQRHADQLAYALLTQSAMVEKSGPQVATWGKFIIICPNGRCASGVCSSGNFWTNFSTGEQSTRFYDDFYELVGLVDERYRTLPPQNINLDTGEVVDETSESETD